jgi:hypothetical protein
VDAKICNKCKQFKDFECFSKDRSSKSGLYSRCKECTKLETKHKSIEQKAKENKRSRQYKLKNKEKVKDTAKNWYLKNRDKVISRSKKKIYENYSRHLELQKKYNSNNKEKRKVYLENNKKLTNETKRKRENYRYKNDLNFKIRKSLRSRLNKAIIKNYKTGSAVDCLGISIEKFKIYLENRFVPGMRWDNWGKIDGWEIDHIKPLSLFDLSSLDELNKACHYTNLQPMWTKENRAKGNKTHERDR